MVSKELKLGAYNQFAGCEGFHLHLKSTQMARFFNRKIRFQLQQQKMLWMFFEYHFMILQAMLTSSST